MTNLFKSYDYYYFETDLDATLVIQIFKNGIQNIEHPNNLRNPSMLGRRFEKPYCGFFSTPNRFVIQSSIAFNPKIETTIDITQNGKTKIEFHENNMKNKALIIFISIPFIAIVFLVLFSPAIIEPKWYILPIIMLFPITILGLGIFLLTYFSKAKKKYFEQLIQRYKHFKNKGY